MYTKLLYLLSCHYVVLQFVAVRYFTDLTVIDVYYRRFCCVFASIASVQGTRWCLTVLSANQLTTQNVETVKVKFSYGELSDM